MNAKAHCTTKNGIARVCAPRKNAINQEENTRLIHRPNSHFHILYYLLVLSSSMGNGQIQSMSKSSSNQN